jgi:hypothetical protein
MISIRFLAERFGFLERILLVMRCLGACVRAGERAAYWD